MLCHTGQTTPIIGADEYLERVFWPTLKGVVDDGDLAVFLNTQLDEWEAGEPNKGRDRVVSLLNNALAFLKARIKARIEAANNLRTHLGDFR